MVPLVSGRPFEAWFGWEWNANWPSCMGEGSLLLVRVNSLFGWFVAEERLCNPDGAVLSLVLSEWDMRDSWDCEGEKDWLCVCIEGPVEMFDVLATMPKLVVLSDGFPCFCSCTGAVESEFVGFTPGFD